MRKYTHKFDNDDAYFNWAKLYIKTRQSENNKIEHYKFILELNNDGLLVLNYFAGAKYYYYPNSLKLHREDGPAIEHFKDGYRAYYVHGELHRTDGPTRINTDGTKEYWLNNQKYENITTDNEWLKFQEELLIKEIIE